MHSVGGASNGFECDVSLSVSLLANFLVPALGCTGRGGMASYLSSELQVGGRRSERLLLKLWSHNLDV